MADPDTIDHDHDCPYLPGRDATTRYRFIESCPAEHFESMLERGWRRFGTAFFRPQCASCHECRSLRVDVEAFAANRSMRRCSKHNKDLVVTLSKPFLTEEHLELYDRFHADMEQRRAWPHKPADPELYFQMFVEGRHDFAHELQFRRDDQLLAVALVDILPTSLSAVYCFYDPAERRRSLGVNAVLTEIALARHLDLERLYLGFWIEDNPSMSYKNRYQPHEILAGRPNEEEAAVWRPLTDD